jgi:hypothetical protein
MIQEEQDRPALTGVVITPAMIDAGLRGLRDSGMLGYPRLVDATLVDKVLRVALSAR